MKKIVISLFTLFNLLCSSQNEEAKLLSEYIKIKSVSGNEKPAAQFIENICKQQGFYISVFSNTDSSYNFCASLLPLEKKLPSVLFINHIDVVQASDSVNWLYPPFNGTISNDTIYGRGAIDMKGLAVMQLMALKKIKETTTIDSLKNNIVILFLSGEETGGINGAKKIIEPQFLNQLNPLVVFGEGGGGLTNVIPNKPNELCFFISNAEKKSIWLKLEAKVKANGHGSVHSNKTAHKILLKAINKIENTEERIVIDKSTKQTFKQLGNIMGGYKGFVIKHINWWIFKPLRRKIFNNNEALNVLATNSYQLTQIQNPQQGPVNQVAQSAVAYYDCRLLPNKSEKPLLLKLMFRILDPRIKLSIIDESPTAEPTRLNNHYYNMKKALLKIFPTSKVMPVLFPATTDNSYFRSVDVPAYGLLPFQLNKDMIESVHASNEKLPIKAINDGINVYVEFLKNYVK
ncbi:MAG: M20/M25/M40 family metallo-hydrolase [Bacteroidota bacterium]|nr:M20/M25/M40 family metallo-hydrolase [Bacteroidota bacterium]